MTKAITASILSLLALATCPRAAELRLMQTPGGTHYGISGARQAKPAPTLFIISNPISVMHQENMRHLLVTGEALKQRGWIYVVLDPACEGFDLKPGQPSSLAGWALRAKKGEDFIGPYVRNCRDVLDHLIKEGLTDEHRVAVEGVSRGGFCALHFAAREPRIHLVAGVSPVTNPLALTEFAGVTKAQVAGFTLDDQLEALAGRKVWISIGNSDDRVSTDDCVAFTRRIVATTRRLQPRLNLIPVHLHVGESAGHRSPDDAYAAAAEFLLRALP